MDVLIRVLRVLVAFCIFHFNPSSAFAQENLDKLTKGDLIRMGWKLQRPDNERELEISDIQVRDVYTRKRLVDAHISIYQKDSTTLITDDILYNGNVKYEETVTQGRAEIPLVDRIVIKVELDGYEPLVQAIDIPPVDRLKKISGKDVPKYRWMGMKKMLMRRSMHMTNLGEAQVTASRLALVVKGDTLEYNVANLRLSAGSMLDNLIRSLPGAQLGNDGRIMVNGEFVSRLLVNGREFFNGDAMVALRNLPYYTVGKVQVYHDIGRGFLNEEDSIRALKRSRSLTMDVRLKKIYSEMWLANFEVGEGSRTHKGEWANVYFGRFFAMRFTDHSSIGIYGLANNVGKNYSATHDGNWREMSASGGGEPVSQTGGIDFSVDGKKTKVKFNTTLKATHETNDEEIRISRQTFLATGDLYDRFRQLNATKGYNFNWNARLSKDHARYSFSLFPQLSYSNRRSSANSLSATFEDDPLDATRTSSLDSVFGHNQSTRLVDLLNTSRRSVNRQNYTSFYTNVSFSGNYRLPSGKSLFPLNASVSYNRRTSQSVSLSHTTSPQTAFFNNRYRDTPQHNFTYSLGTSHSLFNVRAKRFYLSYTLAYIFEHNYSYDEQTLRQNDEEQPDWLPSFNTGEAWEYNLRNSYCTDQYSDRHLMTLTARHTIPGVAKGRNIRFDVSLPINLYNRQVKDWRNGNGQNVRKRSFFAEPNVSLSFLKEYVTATYIMRKRLPDLNQMLDIVDDSYALSRAFGNPHLKTATDHELKLGYRLQKQKRSLWLFPEVAYTRLNDHITTARTYNRVTGVTTSQPTNINGNWWTSASVNFGSALDKDRHFNISTDTRYTLAHSVDFSSDATDEVPRRYVVMNNRLQENVKLSYAKGLFRASLGAWARWNRMTSDETNFRNMNYTDMTYSLSFAMPIVATLDFDTDLNLTMRRGYHERSMNTTEWVWNAALSAKFGQRGQWVVRAIAFDILQNLSNVTNTLNAQGHTEWWYNSARSYASLHLVYHIKVKPSKKGIDGK